MVTESADNIRVQPLVDEMRTSYLDYAMSVIVSRALPDVRDGLKPVQRRILYAMDDLSMRANGPYRKSARIVGEVLGKYHPHGDVPVYEAMVRMAQSWSMRAPLIDGQGNYGSIDHDPPAAMRYTEARLSPICEEMLADLDKNTVDFTPNFDESLNEPTVLPGRIPNLLLNGAAGIAVAMACKIPPHNLGEIAAAMKLLLANEDTSIADLLEVLKGPDFPTAGIIFAGENREDLRVAYARGRGGFTLRGRQHIEEASGSRVQIVFTEIPYQSNKVRIVEQIALHVREKKIEGIRDLRDESDRHGLRLVVELGRDANLRTVLAHLFRSTDLQVRYDTNFVALTPEQDDASSLRPRTFNLLQMITAFIDHRRVILTRRTEFDLEKARDRHHIVEGLLKAIDMIDEIIAAIRAADSADAARDTLQDDPFGPLRAPGPGRARHAAAAARHARAHPPRGGVPGPDRDDRIPRRPARRLEEDRCCDHRRPRRTGRDLRHRAQDPDHRRQRPAVQRSRPGAPSALGGDAHAARLHQAPGG